MKQITNFIKKIPKPYSNSTIGLQHMVHREHRKIAWQYYVVFSIFYVFGFNVFFTKNLFVISLLIKFFWIGVLLVNLHQTVFSFAEGFIFYAICFTYVFHFFDIFLLFFFAIFIPNGQKLLEE